MASKSACDRLSRDALYSGGFGRADLHVGHVVKRGRLVSCRDNGSVNGAEGGDRPEQDQDVEDLGRELVRVSALQLVNAGLEGCCDLASRDW